MDIARDTVVIGATLVGGALQAVVIKSDVFRRLAVPIDGGRAFHGQPLLGANKTWRGLLVMTVGVAAGAAALFPISPPVTGQSGLGHAALGAAMGLVYIVAELPNSYIKRRLGIDAGARANRGRGVQYVIDQLDSVVGVIVLLALVAYVRWGDAAVLLGGGLAAHAGFDRLLHRAGVK